MTAAAEMAEMRAATEREGGRRTKAVQKISRIGLVRWIYEGLDL